MANELKMAEIDAILTLHKSGHSKSEICRLLGIHRETVAKYIAQQDGPKPAEPDHRLGTSQHRSQGTMMRIMPTEKLTSTEPALH